MHPSIALQAAELELEREQNPHGHHDGDGEQGWREAHLPPPPTFLHFAPRWHQRRRTMTGVMAGYFDPPPRRNEPLPVIPGAHALLARTAAPAISEEELERMERELRKRRRAKAAAKRITTDLVDAHDVHDNADITARVIVAENPSKNGSGRSTNRSSSRSRSDSPLTTDFKLVSEESTPPLTPLSSRSDFSVRLHLEDGKPMDTKSKVKAKPDKKNSKLGFHTIPTVLDTPPDIVRSVAELRNDAGSMAGSASKTSTIGGERRSSFGAKATNPRKRKFSEIERPNQRSRTQLPVASTNSNPKSKPKTRPGWKGWVEVEGSPEPMTKLINLDAPPAPLEKRTRSGKVAPPPEKSIVGTRAPRGRPSVPRSSTGADGSSIPPTESTDGGDVPLGAISGNATPLPADGNAAAEV